MSTRVKVNELCTPTYQQTAILDDLTYCVIRHHTAPPGVGRGRDEEAALPRVLLQIKDHLGNI